MNPGANGPGGLMTLLLIISAFAAVMLADELPWRTVLLEGLPAVAAVFFGFLALVLITGRVAQLRADRYEDGELSYLELQRLYSRAQRALGLLALGGQLALLFVTDWPQLVRSLLGESLFGLDEWAIVAPFLIFLIAGYVRIYPVDRRIREAALNELLFLAEPVKPVWSLGQYLSFHLRFHVLLVGGPLLVIMSARDGLDRFRPVLVAAGRAVLAPLGFGRLAPAVPDGLLTCLTALVVLLSPFWIRALWYCRPLSAGPLRDRLAALARGVRLRFRDILLWPTYGVVVNAAAVGLIGRVRFVLLSDGLIESLTDGQLEAVFAHEVGHIKRHHLPLLVVAACLIMGVLGLGAWHVELAGLFSPAVVEGVMFAVVLVVWFVAFGLVSRAFEREADLFALEALSVRFDRQPGGCGLAECRRHGPAFDATGPRRPLCLGAAELAGSALQRAAVLNAVSRTARSWRHGSIEDRCDRLRAFALDEQALRRFRDRVGWIKLLLIVGLVAVGLWGVWAVLVVGLGGSG